MLAHCRLTKAPKLSPKSLQKYPELLLITPKVPLDRLCQTWPTAASLRRFCQTDQPRHR